jgi:hypothetical protein
MLPAFVTTGQGAWLAGRSPAHLNPPRRSGEGGTRPLALEVRLDAVAAVILDGLSYRRAGRMVGISRTEVGDGMDLLLGPLADLGFCQPDGTFITSLDDLGQLSAHRTGASVSQLGHRVPWPVRGSTGWSGEPPGTSDRPAGRCTAERLRRPDPAVVTRDRAARVPDQPPWVVASAAVPGWRSRGPPDACTATCTNW